MNMIHLFNNFTSAKKLPNAGNILKDNRKHDIKKVQSSLNKYRADFGLLRITQKNVTEAIAHLEEERGQIDIFESDIEIARTIIELFPERSNARGLNAKAYQHLVQPKITDDRANPKPKTLNIFANALQQMRSHEKRSQSLTDTELSFTIRNYSIEAGIYNGSMAMRCDCPVRRSRQICKHQLALLSDDPIFQTAAKAKRVFVPQHLTSNNIADVQTLRSWLTATKFGDMLDNLALLEQQRKRDKDANPTKKQRITMYFELGGE